MVGRFLRAFGRKEIWSWPLFWFALPVYFLLSFLFDVFLAQSWRIEWLLIAILTFAVATLLAVGVKFLIIDRFFKTRNAGLVNFVAIAAIGAVKNVLVGELSVLFGLVQSVELVDWAFRIYGGAGLAIGVLLGFVYILGSRVDHNATIGELEVIRAKLVRHRAQAETLLVAEREALLKQTQQVLLPRLDQIHKTLVSNSERTNTIDALRELVQTQVRPLSESLAKVAENMTVADEPSAPLKPRAKLLQNNFQLKPLIQPGTMLPMILLGNWFLSSIILGNEAANWSLLYSIPTWLIIVVAKLLIPENFKVKRGWGIALLVFIGFNAAHASYWPLKEFSHNFEQDMLLLLVVNNIIGSVVGFAYSRSYQIDRIEAVNQMTRDNESLAREVALFEQQMWIARRNWSFVVHGTVQAALTAAITRLSAGEELEQYQIDLALQDISRASAALAKTPDIDVDLTIALPNLVATWSGICEIKFNVTERANRALLRDANARMCVNEICKEAVSNAVRHGEANKIEILIERTSDELLLIEAADNGRGVGKSIKPGVGSRMLDDLTVRWSISKNRATAKTVMQAWLPLAGISAGKL